MGLEFLHCLWGIVDKGETGSLSTTELSSETEDVDLVLASLVEFGEFASELILGDVGTVWVEDVTILKNPSSAFQFLNIHIPNYTPMAFKMTCSHYNDCSKLMADSMEMMLTYTTICFRPRRGLRMNLRVRSVTGALLSAIFAII